MQRTAYEMRISDWSSDVCSSDLKGVNVARVVLSAGCSAVAVLPGAHDDPLVIGLRDLGIPHRAVEVTGQLRVNLTIAESTAERSLEKEGVCPWRSRCTSSHH